MTVHRSPIVANVLTGFLGAGKTTLLNRLLSSDDVSDTAVIINEFGSIGLDHLLVESIDEEIVLLKSGCICCTIRGDLKEAVLSLFERRKAGTVPPFRRLVIETTGLADPAPILATLAADMMLKYHFAIGNVVTVIDVPNGLRNLEIHSEAARQVALADRIVVTKADLGTEQERAMLVAAVEGINPTARIETGERDHRILTEEIHDLSMRPDGARRQVAAERRHDHDHDGGDPDRHGNLHAVSLTADRPLSWSRFSLWLSMLINRHGSRILRLKGILDIEEVAAPVVVHGVQHLIHPPFHLKGWPRHEGAEIRQSRLVVITDGDLGDLQRSFDAFTGTVPASVDTVPGRHALNASG